MLLSSSVLLPLLWGAVTASASNATHDGGVRGSGGRGGSHHDGSGRGGGGGGDCNPGDGGGYGPHNSTCSDTLSPRYRTPSKGQCITGFEQGVMYSYPEDFGEVLNKVSIYTCPSSDTRVIISNGIPDHDLAKNNSNDLCETHWMVTLPLNPVLSSSTTEPPARGIIGISLNGVPAYGSQERRGANAVEAVDQDGNQVGVPYYGHSARAGDWHYHSGEFGLFEEIQSVPSDQLIGYAMDGFPIYGPLDESQNSSELLDDCNGMADSSSGEYRYHVRIKDDIDETSDYCNETNVAVNWRYIIGCFSGDLTSSSVEDSSTATLPDGCELESSTGGSPATSPLTAMLPTASGGRAPSMALAASVGTLAFVLQFL